jgi:hypothetical protein
MSKLKQTSMFMPLDVDRQEIRLARIKPSRTPEVEIECDLTTTGLQAHPQPQFEALSHF